MTDAYTQGATQISLRNDTSANWSSSNPVLAVGEFGVNTTNNRIKIGDGATTWNELNYQGVGKGNLLLNADFSVQQRPIGWASLTDSATEASKFYYGIDRWRLNITGKRSLYGTGVASTTVSGSWLVSQATATSADALSESYRLTNYLSVNPNIFMGDNLSRANIHQRIDKAEAAVNGKYTISWWARLNPLLSASGDNPTYSSWISAYYRFESETSSTSAEKSLVTSAWKRYSHTFDLVTPPSSSPSKYLEVGFDLPTDPIVTWTKNIFTSKTPLTVGPLSSATITVLETTGLDALAIGAKIRLTERSGTRVMEGVIASHASGSQDLSITVTDKYTGSGLVQNAGTTPAWDIAVSTYVVGSLTPSTSSAITISTNIVSPEISTGKVISVRNRANPQNWMTGKVTGVSGTSITLNNVVASTAKTITRVNVTDSNTATIYSTSLPVDTYPVGTMVSITQSSSLIPDSVVGRWFVASSALGSVTITGSRFKVEDTGTISAASTLLGTSIGFGGTAASGWDINVQSSYHNEIDFWGVQLEPDRGASMFQLASGNPDAELNACQRYFQSIDKLYTSMVSYNDSTDSGSNYGFGFMIYSAKRALPTITYPSVVTGNYSCNWVDGNTETVSSIESSVVSSESTRFKAFIGGSIGTHGTVGTFNIQAPVYIDAEL